MWTWTTKTLNWISQIYRKIQKFIVVIFRILFAQSNTPTTPLQRGKTPTNECPEYDTEGSDGEAPVMLVLWGMRRTPSLPLLPGPLWPGMVAPDRALYMGYIELHTDAKLNCLN